MQASAAHLAPDASPIALAADWLAQIITGSLGTSIAVIAIGWVGLAMLQGHLDWRRAGRIILGCFILFGSPLIARGLIDALQGTASLRPNPPPPAIVATPTAAPQFDPYAGAALPH